MRGRKKSQQRGARPQVSALDVTCKLATRTSLAGISSAIQAVARGGGAGIISVREDSVSAEDVVGDGSSCVLDVGSSIQLNDTFFKLGEVPLVLSHYRRFHLFSCCH